MSLSPQRVDFDKIWANLSDGIGKIVTLTGVKGMPMFEYVSRLSYDTFFTQKPHYHFNFHFALFSLVQINNAMYLPTLGTSIVCAPRNHNLTLKNYTINLNSI